MGRLFVIKVSLPNYETMTFTTQAYTTIEGRVKFVDKYGRQKDFPQSACFIEEKSSGEGF